MNDIDRLRARILEQSAQKPQPEHTNNTLMNVLLVTLTLGFIFVVAIQLI